METKFTWIPFYTELASKLLYYKSRRKELAKLIYSGFEKKEIKFLHDGDGSNFKELDPFTIYSVFNRSMKNRVLLAQKIKELFGLKSEVPSDFVGIPVQNPMMASYISFSENRSPDGKDVDRLWKLFEQAQDEKADISKVFNSVLKQYSIAIPKLTMGLYYISPNHFLALDGNNRDYLYHYGFEDWDFLDLQYSDYSELLELVREKMNKKIIKENSFPEFSANAYAGVENADSYSNMEEKKQLYLDLLKANNNLILTGAPGTGKTYLAKEIAKEMGAEAGFVQFHPSYDYTDFVEGLRPKEENGNIGFERKDGVFKEFCKKALLSKSTNASTLAELNSNPIIWKVSLAGTGDNPIRTDCLNNGYVRIGWPNYGDVEDFNDYEQFNSGGKNVLRAFQNQMKEGDIVMSCYSAKEVDAIGVVVGEYEYKKEGGSYPRYRRVKWLVKDIRENIVELNNGRAFTLPTVYKASISVEDALKIVNKYSPSSLVSNESRPFVFIIDEINRGEISKIFGELFFSIDPGYRGEKGMVQTQYQNMIEEGDIFKKGFYVPENVYIIGTMNDIDRSVESMDFAMRRRFAWKELTTEESYEAMKGKTTDPEKVRQRMFALNDEIAKTPGLNKSYQIGAAYFLKLDEYGGDFDKLWEYHLKGLLYEYLRGNRDADEQLKKLESAYKGVSESVGE